MNSPTVTQTAAATVAEATDSHPHPTAASYADRVAWLMFAVLLAVTIAFVGLVVVFIY